MAEQPGWSGAGGAADEAWNTVALGGAWLPGIWTVTGLECGIEHDKRKRRGKEGAASRDLGIEVPKFALEGIITEAEWPLMQAALPSINPRALGKKRNPVEIIHPEPNSLGIKQVRIVKLVPHPPTARGGKKYVIHVEEWFEEPKDTSGKKDALKSASTARKGDPTLLAAYVRSANPPLPTPAQNLDEEDNMNANTFGKAKTLSNPSGQQSQVRGSIPGRVFEN